MEIFPSRSGARYALPWRAKGDDNNKVKAVDVKGLCKTWDLGKSFHDSICTVYYVAVQFFFPLNL